LDFVSNLIIKETNAFLLYKKISAITHSMSNNTKYYRPFFYSLLETGRCLNIKYFNNARNNVSAKNQVIFSTNVIFL
ncbi:hypothetical protein, partial [Tetragenococcus koreensis]